MADNGPTVPLDVPTLDFEASEEEPSNVWARLMPLGTNKNSYPVIDLVQDTHWFGRAVGNDTKFVELGISGKHCRIYKETITSAKTSTDIVKIEDTSTNGTYVNGALLKKSNMLLSAGDTIMFLNTPETGEIKFVFKPSDNRSKDKDTDGPSRFYDIGALLGTGQFASVHLCIHKATGQQYAIKIIDKKKFAISSSTDRPDALLGEVEILQKLDHPSCIKINETFETDDTLYLVLELVTGGELFDKIVEAKRFDEARARNYFLQMLEAIKYLHDKGIVHRDLKPENILLKSRTEDLIKLSDFGLSRIMEGGSNMKTMCGTPQYVAPEVLTFGGTASAVGYGKACDLWSLGVILFILLVGYPPFYEENRTMPLFEQITSAAFDFPDRSWANISMEAKDLIFQLLTVDASKRIDVHTALAHPWITGGQLTPGYSAALLQAIKLKNAGRRVSIAPVTYSGAKYTDPANGNGNVNGHSNEEEEEDAGSSRKKKAKATGTKASAAAKKVSKTPTSPTVEEEDEEEEEEVEEAKPAKAGKKTTAAAKKSAKKSAKAAAAAEDEEEDDEEPAKPAKASKKASAAKKASGKKAAKKTEEEEEEEEDLPAPANGNRKRTAATGDEEAAPTAKRAKK